MPPALAPDFRLYHGNDLEVLAGVLAAELARPAPSGHLLDPDILLIPQPAMRRWLQKTMAETHGIAANLEFLTPGEFVTRALNANLGGDDAAFADAATLRWRLWSLLADDRQMREPVFAPLRAVLAGTDGTLAAWMLAGELAAAFEKYQAWRRGWLLHWDAGGDRDDWQAELWRRASRGLGHRARRLHDYLLRFDGPDAAALPVPSGLPPRVFAFACQNVSPDVLRVISTVARAGSLHFFFVSPVRGWWGDLQTARERLRVDAAAVFAGDDENPLLRANGAAGRDFINLLFADEAVQPTTELEIYAPPDPDQRKGLLHRLQRDLLARRPVPGVDESAQLPDFDPGERSLQVHACHTRLREVQVLHEQLRALLEADATLQPRDIAVLTPVIDDYAPLVHAVFGAAAAAAGAIPYTLADGSALAGQPLAAWWLRLLALPSSRFTGEEVLALLSPAPVARHLGLAPVDLERLVETLGEAGVRWGLDGCHRRACGAPGDEAYSWRWSLDRLLLGHATGDDAGVAGVAPLPVLEGSALAVLDAFLSGLNALERHARVFAEVGTAAQWQARLQAALEDLLPERPVDAEDRRSLEGLRAQIARFGDELASAGLAAALPHDVVQAWFRTALSEADDRQPWLSGGVTFGRMVPMRLIPFRVVCLLGMNDGDYPRRDPAGALNRLAAELGTAQRRHGDRSLREDDRFLFLQLLAAATEVFYLSYLGADPRSGETRPPSVLVAELLDVASRYFRDAKATRKRLVLVHPLQPFAPQAFGARRHVHEDEQDARRRISYSESWRPAADPRREAKTTLPVFAVALPDVDASIDATGVTLDRDRLYRALANPARHFLQQRLGLRLPRKLEPLPDSEPFDSLDQLRLHSLRQSVFAALRAGEDDVDDLHARLLAEARVAPAAAGRLEVREQVDLLAGVARFARDWAADAPVQQPYEIALSGRRLTGTLANVHGRGLLQFRPGVINGKSLLDFGLDWLVWSALGEMRPVLRLVPGAPPVEIMPVPAEQARVLLLKLMALHDAAGQRPLPFLPKSGWIWFSRRERGDDSAKNAARKGWCGDDRHDGEGEDVWVRLALRGSDPFFDDDVDAFEQFKVLSGQIFAGLPTGEETAEDDDG